MKIRFALALLIACVPAAFCQGFEASVSGGESYIPSKSSDLGSGYQLKDGFRLALRMTLNWKRFFGHEFGYGYTHTSLESPASLATGGVTSTSGLSAHQGFYDFLVYALPEGSHVRPFACGGVQFTSFTPAGSYTRETKYGVNWGGGIKVRVKENWGFRTDIRQYNMSKPFNDQLGSTGRLNLYEFSVGVSFMM
jgi:opacity protein-like surface antigen